MSRDPFLFVVWLREQSPIAPFARAFRLPRSAAFSFVYCWWAGFLLMLDGATRQAGNGWANLAVRAVLTLWVLCLGIATVGLIGCWLKALQMGSQADVEVEKWRQETLQRPRLFIAEMIFAVWGALYLAGLGTPLVNCATALAWTSTLAVGLVIAVRLGLKGWRAARQERTAAR